MASGGSPIAPWRAGISGAQLSRRRCNHRNEFDRQPSRSALIEDRLIVALDAPNISEAHATIETLEGVVSFFQVGLWRQFAAGFGGLLDYLLANNKNIFTALRGPHHRGRFANSVAYGPHRRGIDPTSRIRSNPWLLHPWLIWPIRRSLPYI
jgi:hypothetical protein